MGVGVMFANRARCGVVIGLALGVLLSGGCAQNETETAALPEVAKPYLGEEPPGDSPVLFARPQTPFRFFPKVEEACI